MKPQIFNGQQLRLAAQDKAFNHQYDKTRKTYSKKAKELQRTKELATSLYGISDKTHELAECSKKIKRLTEERNFLGKQLNEYRRVIDGEAKEKINDILILYSWKMTKGSFKVNGFMPNIFHSKNRLINTLKQHKNLALKTWIRYFSLIISRQH